MADFNLGTISEKRKITGGSGTCEVEFCSTDPYFLTRLEEACKEIENLRATNGEELSKPGTKVEAYFDFDRKVREVIDGLFHAPVCDTAFKEQYMFGLYNDMPLWLNIILWAVDETYAIDEDKAKDKFVKRIKQYENKYTRKYHK